jgi:hypothetical protein
MKRNILFLLAIVFLAVSVQLYSQEVQMSAGLETGIITLEENFNSWSDIGGKSYIFKGTNTSAYWGTGISLMVRVFADADAPFTTGFIFRDRAVFVTNYIQTGNLTGYRFSPSLGNGISSGNGGSHSWAQEKYSVFEDNFFMSSMDFDLGYSSRIRISKGFSFYADLGVNLTIMDYEEYESISSSKSIESYSYLGAGIFAQLSLQISFTDSIYMEFGLNSILNAFSSQSREFIEEESGQKVKVEYTGRWDSPSIAAFLHIGWRISSETSNNTL